MPSFVTMYRASRPAHGVGDDHHRLIRSADLIKMRDDLLFQLFRAIRDPRGRMHPTDHHVSAAGREHRLDSPKIAESNRADFHARKAAETMMKDEGKHEEVSGFARAGRIASSRQREQD